MKVAICAQGNSHTAPLDPRFGRCGFFAIVDTTQNKWEFIPNPGATSGGGAGIQAAQELAKRGVKAIVTGRVGPNAMAVLQSAGIEVYTAVGETVQEAYQNFQNKNTTPLEKANAPSHAGIKQK
ncbi:MAG: NifB/NifX family molybdenum-iron cluster-binding protein [Armatimonadetes bacterium]|nr:NifB/NifX family molybdenum-iron cluster-binding protein [Armatimonadota bacterium]